MKHKCEKCKIDTVHNKCKGVEGGRCTKCGNPPGNRKKAIYGYSKHQAMPVAVRSVKVGQDSKQMFYHRDGKIVTRVHNAGKDWVRERFEFDSIRKAKAFVNAG